MSSLLSFGEKSLVNGPITRKKNKRGDRSSTEEETNVAKRPNNKPNAHEEDNKNIADRKESVKNLIMQLRRKNQRFMRYVTC